MRRGEIADGYAYTHTTHLNAEGQIVAEHWLIHGAAHAWSCGSKHGSYTDAKGPDASREMMRFFRYAHEAALRPQASASHLGKLAFPTGIPKKAGNCCRPDE